MKKYTNKILIITAIVLLLGMVIGYTIDFQTGYRSGRIKYEQYKDTVTGIILDDQNADTVSVETGRAQPVETRCTTSLQDETSSEKELKTSNQ